MQQVMEFTEWETKVAQIRKEQGTRQREEDATTLPKLEIDESSLKKTKLEQGHTSIENDAVMRERLEADDEGIFTSADESARSATESKRATKGLQRIALKQTATERQNKINQEAAARVDKYLALGQNAGAGSARDANAPTNGLRVSG